MRAAKFKGFTLIEMIIVIVILSILASVSAQILVQQFQLFNQGQELLNADWQGKIALGRMEKDIRNAIKIATAKKNMIIFQDYNGETIQYNLDTTKKQLFLIYQDTSKPLADNIQQIELQYYDKNGNETSEASNIRYITIKLTIITSNNEATTGFNLTTAIYPWNLNN